MSTRYTKEMRAADWFARMARYGIYTEDACALRRCEMTLTAWAVKECGDGSDWALERDGDEGDGRPYMVYHGNGAARRYAIPDRERGALKRAAAIVAHHPGLAMYHQGDPRGCCLYVVRVADLPKDHLTADHARRGKGWAVRTKDGNLYACRFDTMAEALGFCDRQTLDAYATSKGCACNY